MEIAPTLASPPFASATANSERTDPAAQRRFGYGLAAVLSGLALFAIGFVTVNRTAHGIAADRRLVFRDVAVAIEDEGVTAVRALPPESATVDPVSGAVTPSVEIATTWSDNHLTSYRVAASGAQRVCLVHCPAGKSCEGACPGRVESLHVLPRRAAVWAVLGTLLVFFGLPFVVRSEARHPWLSLLSDPGGSLSLAHVQLFLWLLAGVLVYFVLCFTTRSMPPLDTTLVALLGMGGLTTVLGGAANPKSATPAAGAAAPPDEPRLADLVEDHSDRGDISRYQFLLLSLLGAAAVLVSFFHSFTVPEVPAQFLALMGASQATYLGVKQLKSSQIDAEKKS